MERTQAMKIYMESTTRDHEDESTNFDSTGITIEDIKLCGFDNPTGWWVSIISLTILMCRITCYIYTKNLIVNLITDVLGGIVSIHAYLPRALEVRS
ncbi:hypothetical protein GIB67_009502 [Kingdonia uniflora]|uniref:Uncharacterized protein n=1 Tax=Kingdonia uniflora TaxID=39325 RepID=A0A7J7NVX7_9MAGN|nr:hypothetical protein GIB67_009502 [Kingdonia uniflora]